METADETMSSTEPVITSHPLSDKWVLWAHLPHDTDWSLSSYQKIMELSTVEEVLSLYSAIPEKLVKNCMLFLMRKHINPIWEDPANRDGGCFSFKVINKNVYKAWVGLSYTLVGETLMKSKNLLHIINGITVSPKRSFCIIKIWLADCTMQNPNKLAMIQELDIHGCLFKKHKPEY
jgi:translation initiation factor 4E